MIRSNTYDLMPSSIKEIKKSLSEQELDANVLKKSRDEDLSCLKKFVGSYSKTESLGKKLFSQFVALKNDYDSGIINSVRYKDALTPLHDLLVSTSEKIDIKSMNVPVIAAELKRIGFN